MSRLVWRIDRCEQVAGRPVPVASDSAGISRYGPWEHRIKSLAWPVYKALTDPICDGYIEKDVGRLIHRYWRPEATFLEIACGDTSLARFLPPDAWYNAFDTRIPEFHLQRLLRARPRANPALVTAERIPLDDGVADLLVCVQAFHLMGNVERVAAEIRRVAGRGAILICTIGNPYSEMTTRLGGFRTGVHRWRFREFSEWMAAHGFPTETSYQKGVWFPRVARRGRRYLSIPRTAPTEEGNLYFFYVFRVDK